MSSVTAADISFWKSAASNDTPGNGGVISTTQIVSGALNNAFPNVTNTNRIAGITRYRKQFLRNRSTTNLGIVSGEVYINTRSTGDDYYRLKAGTDTDTQASLTVTGWAGTGLLAVSAGSGESELQVTYDAADGIFSGEALDVLIYDGTNEVKRRVLGTPVWNSNTATFTISEELGYNFVSASTTVASLVHLGSVATSYKNWVETSTSGTFDETTYAPTLYNVGTVTDTFTLTFSDSINFTVSGTRTGSLGAGSTATNFLPVNGSSYYFLIDKSGWGGSWVAGDKIVFDTVHSGKAFWAKEVVAAGTASKSNNTTVLGWKAESA